MFTSLKRKLISSKKFCHQFFDLTLLKKLLDFILPIYTQSDTCRLYTQIYTQFIHKVIRAIDVR